MKNSTAVILGVFMVLAFGVFGWYFKQSRQQQQTVRVVGYATHEFESNTVKWSVSLSQRVSMSGTEEGYRMMAKKLESFKKVWESTGISTDEFKVFPISVNREYGNGGQVGYNLTQRIYILSDDLTKIEQIAIDPEVFVDAGLAFDNSQMEFFSSELEDIKKEL